MFKTQVLYQNDEKWKNVKLGNSKETIGGWGGLLTCLTMILNGIGYDEETPATVNEKMKNHGSFLTALLGPPYAALVWPNCIYRGMTRCEKSDAPIVQIDKAVAAGKPVILQVDSSKQAGIQAHFVLVKEKKGNDYIVYDPYRYDGDHPDQEVLLTSRYKYHGATLESEISAVLWFDFYSAALPKPPKGGRVPVPAEKYPLYVAEDFLVLRASPSVDSYPWKCLMTGTELTCLENKATVKAKLGKKDQWIRVQDPNEVQGYVAAWFVNSTRFPELVLPPDQALPFHKKWCLNNVALENPQLESWVESKDKDGKRTFSLLPYHQPIKSFNVLPKNTVVYVLQANQTMPGDTESSWSGIAYQETYYDPGAKKFITSRVTGWINDDDLDDYNEHPDERFRESVVDILYATQMTTDAAQYMTLEDDDVYDPSKVKHNLCGEFCVAYILGQKINQVLDKWKDSSRAIYDSKVGKADKPLEVPHMEDLITMHLGPVDDKKWARYKLDKDNQALASPSFKPLAFSDQDPRRTDQRRASDDFMTRLRDYYFITTLKIDLNTGDLATAHSTGEGNHWVVLDKITRNGSRVELYNPFPNKRQEYTFSEFYKSIGGDPNTGWWIKREVNPTFAKQRDQNNEPAFQPPIFQVPIEDENKTPDLKDAEQYIKVEGLKKTNLCGEFSVSFILTQSMENTLRRWMENQESLRAQGKPPKLSDLVTGLQAYGLIDGKAMPDQSKKSRKFTIDRVLQFWKAVQPDLFNSILGDGNNEKTGPTELKTMLEAYGYKKRVDFSDGGLLSSPGRTAEKLKTHFLICGVTIDGSKAGRLGGSIPHWIVVDKITPIGNLVGGNGGWVELYNPFLNRWEEYSYREFLDAYNGGGLWVARDITPGFAPQYRVGVISKGKDSKKDAQAGGKKENAKKRGEPAPAQNELAQNSLNRSPSADIEALLRERFKFDSFPPEIVQWIGEQARGNELLVNGLIDALLDFGIISIDIENKKCNPIDFQDASLSHKIENALQMGMDKSNAASQQVFKAVNVIGSAFASMAIGGIKDVQARVAADDLKKKESKQAVRVIPREDVPVPAYRVMWDWEMNDFTGIWRDELPGVFRCGEINDHSIGHYVTLTKEWQFFWFDLCCKIYYGKYHQDLTSEEYTWLGNRWTALGATKRAFTNLHGLDKFRNYVMKQRLDSEDPKIYTLVCGGASLAGTPVEFKKGKKRMWMLKVACFDGNKPPPPVETIDPYTDPRVFFATTIRSKTIPGTYNIPVFEEGDPACLITREIKHGYSVNAFPQFRKDDRLVDCPVPLIATEDIYYPLKYLVPISTGSKAYPYFPQETANGT